VLTKEELVFKKHLL
jgi:hypothetical protein